MENLKTKYERLIEIFKELSKVPRNSKKEDKIADYVVDFAKKHKLEVYKDELNNVLVRKPASKGSESRKKIIFQAHLDMVCEKTKDSKHDFEKDPIEIIEEGNILKANQTTLGGDDGIGIATCLVLIEDDKIDLPESYFLFTTQEEIGMIGASNFDYSKIKADYLINLDSEEEDTAIVGCAGGIRIDYFKNVKKEKTSKDIYALEISGLAGGHSGTDINKGRINSNYLTANILNKLNIKIISFKGGNKDNAIPNYTKVEFETEEKENSINETIQEEISKIKITLEDSKIKINLEKIKTEKESITLKDTQDFLDMVLNLKQGVITLGENNNFVITSGNVGIVSVEDGNIRIGEALRSSIDKEKEYIKSENNKIAQKHGYEISESGEYPGWKYNPESELQEIYKISYMMSHNGEEPQLLPIHAGLECGIFYKKMPNLDMISIGPDLENVHTVNEKLYLKSCQKYLTTLINMIGMM